MDQLGSRRLYESAGVHSYGSATVPGKISLLELEPRTDVQSTKDLPRRVFRLG